MQRIRSSYFIDIFLSYPFSSKEKVINVINEDICLSCGMFSNVTSLVLRDSALILAADIQESIWDLCVFIHDFTIFDKG